MLVLKHRAEVALHACNVRLPTSMRPDYPINPDPRCDLHWRDLIMMHKKIICSAAIACLVLLFWFLLLHMGIFSWVMMSLLWFCMMIAGFLIGNLHGRYLIFIYSYHLHITSFRRDKCSGQFFLWPRDWFSWRFRREGCFRVLSVFRISWNVRRRDML